MPEEMNISESSLEQILEAAFALLEKQGGFDNETIHKLRQLSSEDDLTKQNIVSAIRGSPEEENETA